MPKNMHFNTKKMLHFTLLALLIAFIFVAALYLADFVTNSGATQNIVNQFGYLGVFVVGMITGFNILIPVPAATFVPVFIAAGLWMPLIILTLVVGTTVADMIGYFIGKWSKDFTKDNYPKTYSRLLILDEKHHNLVLPFVFVYAMFAPFPNEAILIPLAIIGYQFRKLIIPILLGNLVYQTVLSLGVTNIFELIF